LGLEVPLVSGKKALVVSGEAVVVWAGLGSSGAYPCGAVPCVVQRSMSPFSVLRALRRILSWLSCLLTPFLLLLACG
jgi:hypothetical protein